MNLRSSHTVARSLLFAIVVKSTVAGAQSIGATPPATARTRLVILGADHSAQLVGRRNHPGYLRTFLDRVRPDVICIEQPPDEYARGVFYFEGTYEQQYVAVPYALAHKIELRPIDWIPSRDDERLAFGRLEVVDVPPIRPPNDFQSFQTLDSASYNRSFFFADSTPWREEARAFFDTPQPGRRDFSRRLDLYRTYMQAMRIRAVALQRPGATVLVVVGAMHKDDLERTLGDDKQIEIVQPSSLVTSIDSVSADAALTEGDRWAIAQLNVMGLQSVKGPVDWPWVERVVATLSASAGNRAELRMLQTRVAVQRGRLAAAQAIPAYAAIADESSANQRFSFTGVQDSRRVDSYFDPFGNLTVQQRALVEEARMHAALGTDSRVRALRERLMESTSWTPLQRGELGVYWERYIDATSASRSPNKSALPFKQ
jgi:hypothetical protein